MKADGTDLHTVVKTFPGFGIVVDNPSYSPDGKRIVFDASDVRGGDIYIVNRDGSKQSVLFSTEARDSSPSWHLVVAP